jgi:hypothetical protein
MARADRRRGALAMYQRARKKKAAIERAAEV